MSCTIKLLFVTFAWNMIPALLLVLQGGESWSLAHGKCVS